MKKIIAILAAFVATTALFAQQTEKEIYAKYNGKKGVSTVYISPAMFTMMSKLPELEVADDKDVDIKKIRTNYHIKKKEKRKNSDSIDKKIDDVFSDEVNREYSKKNIKKVDKRKYDRKRSKI